MLRRSLCEQLCVLLECLDDVVGDQIIRKKVRLLEVWHEHLGMRPKIFIKSRGAALRGTDDKEVWDCGQSLYSFVTVRQPVEETPGPRGRLPCSDGATEQVWSRQRPTLPQPREPTVSPADPP